MTSPMHSSTMTMRQAYESVDEDIIGVEAGSILPPILVSVLVICIFAALSGTMGMVLYTFFHRML